MTHYLPWRPGARDLTAIGVAVPGIRDRLAPDGELQVDTPTAMVGYWKDDAATRAKFDGPWLRSGDLACRGRGRAPAHHRARRRAHQPGWREDRARSRSRAPSARTPTSWRRRSSGCRTATWARSSAPPSSRAPAARSTRRSSAASSRSASPTTSRPEELRFLSTLPRNPSGKVLRDEVRRLLTKVEVPERHLRPGRQRHGIQDQRRLSRRPPEAAARRVLRRRAHRGSRELRGLRAHPALLGHVDLRLREGPGSAAHAGPRIVSIDGDPCHPFWSFPATKEDLLDNILVARQVSRVSPAAGYATIGRDELAALYVVSTALEA